MPPKLKRRTLSRAHSNSSWRDKPSRADNWKELLMDMFYIAFLIKLSDGYMSCRLNIEEFVYSTARFLGMYMAKFEMDQYLNKFASKDVFNNMYILFYFFGIYVMILNTNETSRLERVDPQHAQCPAYRPYVFGYTVGWLMTRGATVMIYCLVAYFYRPQGVYVFFTKVPILTLSIALIALNFYWPEKSSVDHNHHHSYLSLAASLTEYLGFAVWQVAIAGSYTLKFVGKRAFIPVNINHQSGRTSTFILCVFGAAVIEVMVPILEPNVTYYIVSMLSFSLLVTMALAYFDVIPSKNTTHALGRSRVAGTVWIMIHPIYAFSIFAVGVVLKRMLMASAEDFVENERFMLGIFLGLASLCLVGIRVTHKVLISIGGKLSLALRILIAAGHIIAALVSLTQEYQDRLEVLVIHFSLSVAFLVVDMYKYRRLDLFQMANALLTLDEDMHNISREINSFSGSRDYSQPEGATRVPGGRGETWANVMDEIVAKRQKTRMVTKKKSISKEWSGASVAGSFASDTNEDVIVIPKKFYSSSGLLSRDKTGLPPVSFTHNGRIIKTVNSLGAKSDTTGGGEVIIAKRGQSAVQLHYRPVPAPTVTDTGQVIKVRKGMSASEIKGLRTMSLPEEDEMGAISAPRYLSAASINPNKRRSSLGGSGGPPSAAVAAALAGGSVGKGGRVVEKVLVRRRKRTDSNRTTPRSSSNISTATASSGPSSPSRLRGIMERGESVDVLDDPAEMMIGNSSAEEKAAGHPATENGELDVKRGEGEEEEDLDGGVIQLSRSTKL